MEKVFGPGNQYVTAAKMILQVRILMIKCCSHNFCKDEMGVKYILHLTSSFDPQPVLRLILFTE